jgi:hypothetical protein
VVSELGERLRELTLEKETHRLVYGQSNKIIAENLFELEMISHFLLQFSFYFMFFIEISKVT